MTYIRTERSFEAFSRGAELIRAIHALSMRTSREVESLQSEFDLTADEWSLWADIARGAVVSTSLPAERTYTLTLTENEMARVIHALREDATQSRAVASEFGGETGSGAVPLAHAEACHALAERLCDVLRPSRVDPTVPVSQDERVAADRNADL